MRSIKDFSTEEIEREIERRKDPNEGVPQCCDNPDFTKVIELVKEIVKSVANDGYPIKDHAHWMFDAVSIACYGENFWDWWSDNTE